VNTQIVEHGVNGFLATTLSEWEDALEKLLSNPDLRFKMGQAGRQKVEREYCIQVTAPKVLELLKRY
jgi:glycosyltransferase involved in cell wall biosynthesis